MGCSHGLGSFLLLGVPARRHLPLPPTPRPFSFTFGAARPDTPLVTVTGDVLVFGFATSAGASFLTRNCRLCCGLPWALALSASTLCAWSRP